ncbi:glycosyltransferase family 4 protein [Halosimplex halobium]|uniref:glycosyltransferase family 4 protein n=1 Tax=Halosimplex halobium TaxID=3396618 RepID=UPI003F57B43B
MTGRRICFVCPTVYGYYYPGEAFTGGGAQRQLYLLAHELSDRFDVHFVVGDYGQPKTVRTDGVTLHRGHTPRTDPPAVARLFQVPRLFAAMRRVDPDVFVHRGNPDVAAVVYLLSRALNTPWIYNVANDDNLLGRAEDLPLPLSVLFRQALRDSETVIAQSERQASLLEDRFNVASSTVVPNGYPAVESIQAHDRRMHFLWVGSIDREQKRPDLYLDLAGRFPDSRFLLIGSGPDNGYHDRVRQRASDLDNVTRLGRVHPDEIHDYYEQAIALVNTSVYEGFPNTFLEAWRYATPVVSLDVNPNRFARDAELGGYADGEFDRLADLVERLATDERYRAAMGSRAREFFESELRMSCVARRYGETLKA